MVSAQRLLCSCSQEVTRASPAGLAKHHSSSCIPRGLSTEPRFSFFTAYWHQGGPTASMVAGNLVSIGNQNGVTSRDSTSTTKVTSFCSYCHDPRLLYLRDLYPMILSHPVRFSAGFPEPSQPCILLFLSSHLFPLQGAAFSYFPIGPTTEYILLE